MKKLTKNNEGLYLSNQLLNNQNTKSGFKNPVPLFDHLSNLLLLSTYFLEGNHQTYSEVGHMHDIYPFQGIINNPHTKETGSEYDPRYDHRRFTNNETNNLFDPNYHGSQPNNFSTGEQASFGPAELNSTNSFYNNIPEKNNFNLFQEIVPSNKTNFNNFYSERVLPVIRESAVNNQENNLKNRELKSLNCGNNFTISGFRPIQKNYKLNLRQQSLRNVMNYKQPRNNSDHVIDDIFMKEKDISVKSMKRMNLHL